MRYMLETAKRGGRERDKTNGTILFIVTDVVTNVLDKEMSRKIDNMTSDK